MLLLNLQNINSKNDIIIKIDEKKNSFIFLSICTYITYLSVYKELLIKKILLYVFVYTT